MTQTTPEHRRGYTLTELMLVMLLLALFGITVMALIQSGSSAYKKIADNRTAETNARVALAYLEVRLRQNDAQGSIAIKENPFAPGNALVLHEQFEGEVYDTWVYFLDGTLYECNLLPAGEPPSVELSSAIAQMEEYTLEVLPGGTLRQNARFSYADGQDTRQSTLSSTLTLRSGEPGR